MHKRILGHPNSFTKNSTDILWLMLHRHQYNINGSFESFELSSMIRHMMQQHATTRQILHRVVLPFPYAVTYMMNMRSMALFLMDTSSSLSASVMLRGGSMARIVDSTSGKAARRESVSKAKYLWRRQGKR